MIEKSKYLIINKNRGWRGLAEADLLLELGVDTQMKMIFSFSENVWRDLIIHHRIVFQDHDYYYIVKFEDTSHRLPTPTQQRSVLIKNYVADIKEVNKIEKTKWTSESVENWTAIRNFITNNNNHTTSDWNCIGIRVIPTI